MHGRPVWSRFTAAAVLAALGLGPMGCAFYQWRATPVTDVTLSEEKIGRRQVRFTTDDGVVTLDTTRFAFPYAEGRLVGTTSARIGVPIGSIRRAVVVASPSDDRTQYLKALPVETAALEAAAGERLLLETDSGSVALLLERVDGIHLTGIPFTSKVPSTGHVRVDLRNVRRVEVRELEGVKSAAGTIGVVAGIAAAAFLIVLLTKESCPFVYVDRGDGYELVGEAYAGAAFRSIQRDDLLPLPALADGRVTVMLRNEARETQYTDEVALVLVDHAPDLRAVSTFDAKVALVGEALAPIEARDGAGRPVLDRLLARDGDSVEATPEQVADPAAGGQEEIVASFVEPDGAPVLEIVGGNTPWLDLVFGRFFAAMGGRLKGFLASGNAATAGPGIRAWRQREGVDLAVEVRDGGTWRPVAMVPTVGPMALRRLAVPLPPTSDGDGRVTIRLRGGPGFWRIDQLALSSRATAAASVRRLGALSATTTGGTPDDAAVAVTDGRFNALAQMNEGLALAFDLPPVPAGAERSAFLFTNGYYNVHRPIQGRFAPATLRAVRRQPGGLTRLSRDLAAQYVATMREHPESASTAAGGAR